VKTADVTSGLTSPARLHRQSGLIEVCTD